MCTGAEALYIGAVVAGAMNQAQQGAEAQRAYSGQAAQGDRDAELEIEGSKVRATKIRKAGKRARSEATATYAAAGVDVSRGTPLEVDEEIMRASEDDAMQELLFGERKAERLREEADALRRAGKNAKRSAQFGAMTSILAGGAQVQGGGWTSRATQVNEPVPGQYSTVNRQYG